MQLGIWPIVSRGQLVRAFRPGEPPDREAPFRTLRTHGWATPGISVVIRNGRRAAGRLTMFSVLNTSAARCARVGDLRAAQGFAKAAAKVEQSAAFEALARVLDGRQPSQASAAMNGDVDEDQWPELLVALRAVARETALTTARSSLEAPEQVLTGRVSAVRREGIVLQTETGAKTLVPLWLAQNAHGERVGDTLALVTDQLDESRLLIEASPALDLQDRGTRKTSPFGRSPRLREITAADARLIRARPAPVKVLIPVAIEE